MLICQQCGWKGEDLIVLEGQFCSCPDCGASGKYIDDTEEPEPEWDNVIMGGRAFNWNKK
jgi:hypothetical protein